MKSFDIAFIKFFRLVATIPVEIHVGKNEMWLRLLGNGVSVGGVRGNRFGKTAQLIIFGWVKKNSNIVYFAPHSDLKWNSPVKRLFYVIKEH